MKLTMHHSFSHFLVNHSHMSIESPHAASHLTVLFSCLQRKPLSLQFRRAHSIRPLWSVSSRSSPSGSGRLSSPRLFLHLSRILFSPTVSSLSHDSEKIESFPFRTQPAAHPNGNQGAQAVPTEQITAAKRRGSTYQPAMLHSTVCVGCSSIHSKYDLSDVGSGMRTTAPYSHHVTRLTCVNFLALPAAAAQDENAVAGGSKAKAEKLVMLSEVHGQPPRVTNDVTETPHNFAFDHACNSEASPVLLNLFACYVPCPQRCNEHLFRSKPLRSRCSI